MLEGEVELVVYLFDCKVCIGVLVVVGVLWGWVLVMVIVFMV